MKNRLFTLFALLATAIVAGAQVDEEMPDLHLQFKRMPCIQYTDSAEAQAARSGMLKTTLYQKDALIYGKGSPEIVVCLADVADLKFSIAASDEELMSLFEQFFNGEDKGAGPYNKRSVRGYFKATSNGQFTPHFNIMKPVHLTGKKSSYLASSLMSAALNAIDDQVKDRVSDFDNNKGVQDDVVDGAIVVYAGAGKNTVGDDGFLWPCTWSTATFKSTGGVSYRAPIICPELIQNGYLNSMGVYAHEFCHALGLPDFYDTPNYKYSGMDYWSLMDAGEYMNNGFDPTPFTAYEKIYMGWMEPTELNEPTTITDMKSVVNGGEAYIIYNDANHSEYYLLENRTKDDPLNASLCSSYGEGLMIYHVYESASAWSGNKVNTTSTQRMTIIPANGHFEIKDNLETTETEKYYSEMRGHLWPLKSTFINAAGAEKPVLTYYGIEGNNQLTDEERTAEVYDPAVDRIAPAATLYVANTDGTKFMHKPITEITQSEDFKSISFKFMGGSPTGINDINVNANANKPEGLYLYNGSVIILKNGKKYNLSGQIIR